MKLKDIKLNKDNPRFIKDHEFEKLKESISEFPKMMELRPIVVDDSNVILGGNMRYRALQELGFKDIPDGWVRKASELTEEEKRRFIIADNVSHGQWDWDILANDWDSELLDKWGLELPFDNTAFERPEYSDDDFEKIEKLTKDEKYFYIEYYEDVELYKKIKEALGGNLETNNRINAKYFAKLIL